MTSSLQSLLHRKSTTTPHLVLRVESGTPFFKNYFESLLDIQFFETYHQLLGTRITQDCGPEIWFFYKHPSINFGQEGIVFITDLIFFPSRIYNSHKEKLKISLTLTVSGVCCSFIVLWLLIWIKRRQIFGEWLNGNSEHCFFSGF